MKAIIKNITKKNITTQEGKKFSKIVIACDVVTDDKGTLRTCKAEMSPDYAAKYFKHCGLTSAQLPGMECEVTLRRRAYVRQDGTQGVVTEIRYLNMLDADGKPIILRSNDADKAEDLGF